MASRHGVGVGGMRRWKLGKPGQRGCEQALLLTHRQGSEQVKGWGDRVGKVTQFPQLVVEPYADDLDIPRAQAWARVSHGLPARPGKGGVHAAWDGRLRCPGECVTPHLAMYPQHPVSTVGWGGPDLPPGALGR